MWYESDINKEGKQTWRLNWLWMGVRNSYITCNVCCTGLMVLWLRWWVTVTVCSWSWQYKRELMTLRSLCLVPLTTGVFSLPVADFPTMKLLACSLKEEAHSSRLINPVTRGSQVTSDERPLLISLWGVPPFLIANGATNLHWRAAFTHLYICNSHLLGAKRHVCK